MRDTGRACDLYSSPAPGNVANRAVDAGPIELNRPGLENPLSGFGTSFTHYGPFKLKF